MKGNEMIKYAFEDVLEEIYKFRIRYNRQPKLVRLSRAYYFEVLHSDRHGVVFNLTTDTKTIAGIPLEIDSDPNAEKYVLEG